MIGYDFDCSYAESNNGNSKYGALFYAVQKNGYISLDCMIQSGDSVTIYCYLRFHYNSILYL